MERFYYLIYQAMYTGESMMYGDIKNKVALSLLLLLFLVVSCSNQKDISSYEDAISLPDVKKEEADNQCMMYPISMTRLIVTPERYVNKRVAFVGYLVLGEGDSGKEVNIYTSKEAYMMRMYDDSIRIFGADKLFDYILKP